MSDFSSFPDSPRFGSGFFFESPRYSADLAPHNPDSQENIVEDKSDKEISDFQECISECDEFRELVESINSDDHSKQYSGLLGIRELLVQNECTENDIKKVVNAGLIRKLVKFMKKDDKPLFQNEAIQALTCVLPKSFDQTKKMVDQGVIPILSHLLKSGDPMLKGGVVNMIGWLAYDYRYRKVLVDSGVLDLLLPLLETALDGKNYSLFKPGAWVLSNLGREYPEPGFEKLADSIPLLCTIIKEKEVTDFEFCGNALHALDRLFVGDSEFETMLEYDVISSQVRLLGCPDDTVVKHSCQFFERIIWRGSDDEADLVLNSSSTKTFLKNLFLILKRTSNQDNKWAVYWLLYFMTLRNYFSLILDNPEYIQQCISDLGVHHGALKLFAAAIQMQNKDHMIRMAQAGVFDFMCQVVRQEIRDDSICWGLQSIEKFLKLGALISRKEATNNKYLIKVKQKDVANRIKKLRGGENSENSEFALKILDGYLKESIWKKNLRLKRAIICFRNERRHTLFGLYTNEKKKLCI